MTDDPWYPNGWHIERTPSVSGGFFEMKVPNERITQEEVDDEAAMRLAVLAHIDPAEVAEMMTALQEAWDNIRTAVLKTVPGAALNLTTAERIRRRDTLHREASAALGRGDSRTHKRALADLKLLNKIESIL